MDVSGLPDHRNLICSSCTPDVFGLAKESAPSLLFMIRQRFMAVACQSTCLAPRQNLSLIDSISAFLMRPLNDSVYQDRFFVVL